MHPILCLHIDRLTSGKTEEIKGDFSPEDLDLHEDATFFVGPIKLEGKGYVAEENLLFCFSLKAEVELPCLICNGPVRHQVSLDGIYLDFPIEEVKGGVCDIVPPIREELLLALPDFVECGEGECPSRKELKRFLKAEGEGDVYRPFEDLN